MKIPWEKRTKQIASPSSFTDGFRKIFNRSFLLAFMIFTRNLEIYYKICKETRKVEN